MLLLLQIVPVLCASVCGVVDGLVTADFLSTQLVLRDLETSNRQTRHVNQNGSFCFGDLLENHSYRMSLESDSVEANYALHVVPNGETHKILPGRPVDDSGPPVSEIRWKVSRKTLVADRLTFSLFQFFKQPTVLLSIAALVLVTYLPTLLSQLDPELLAEIEKNQFKPGNK